MNPVRIEPIAQSWQAFKETTGLGHISDEGRYDQVMALMDCLLEDGAMEDAHPLNDLFMLAADLVHQYEQEKYPLPELSGLQMLRFLMEQHELRQSDLAEEIGSQGVVSEIISGKRELNKNHIAALSKQFSVSSAAFF
ncbi:MAG: helix-turn-helix domain-containing protein [Pseudomonadota bacterium]|nr:helix-turn-helix domain-containing protein [Pseudomonadota bacterium]